MKEFSVYWIFKLDGGNVKQIQNFGAETSWKTEKTGG
jgi:hypothetical protein